MVNHIKFTSEILKNFSSGWYETASQKPWLMERLLNASTKSQLQSKLWIINELINLNIFPKRVALLGGWFAHIITPLLIEELKVNFVKNFEIDEDVKNISYKFNNRYNKDTYTTGLKNIMLEKLSKKEDFDMIINTSCEHMFPMRKFREINYTINPLYVLQSTNETKYDDHINCVNSPEELANQAVLETVLYAGSKILDNGMTRFMVIGK